MPSSSDQSGDSPLIMGAPIGIFEVDETGQYIDVNPAACKMLGYSREELLDLSITDLTSMYDDLEQISVFSEVLESGHTRTETVLRHKDGHGINVILDSVLIDNRIVAYVQDITERKEYERELERTKTRLRVLFDDAPEAMLVHDAEGNLVDVNDKAVEYLGHPREELLSKTVAQLDVDHTKEEMGDVWSELDTGELVKVETRHERKDGSTYSAEAWITKIKAHGETQFFGLFRDITDRKQRERELEKREAKYRSLFEDARDAVMLLDRDGFFDCNEMALELYGFESVDALVSHSPWELSPATQPDGRVSKGAAKTHIETAFEEGEAFFEWTHKQSDGTEFPAEVKLSRFQADGEPALHALVRDITERKEYEKAIEQAREELRQIIDLIPDPIFVKNKEDVLLLVNEAYAELLGSTAEAIEGEEEPNLFPETDHYEKLRHRDIEVIESGESTVFEEELTSADGENQIFQTSRIPFETAQTAEDAVIGYARGVTDLKEYEQELEEQRDNLEVLNQVVRHDIRNKLQLVLAYAETAKHTVEDDGEEYLDQVLDATKNAIDITATAREVTEVMLQSDVEHHAVRLRPILESEFEDVRSNHDPALIRLEEPIPDVDVLADDMVESVFRNLVTNAIQHNDKDTPEISVSGYRDGGCVVVRIADNGPGIPDERKEEIFDQEERAFDSKGTGLGLYLVDTLVDRYGGDIQVKDNETGGTTFVLELPIAGESSANRGF